MGSIGLLLQAGPSTWRPETKGKSTTGRLCARHLSSGTFCQLTVVSLVNPSEVKICPMRTRSLCPGMLPIVCDERLHNSENRVCCRSRKRSLLWGLLRCLLKTGEVLDRLVMQRSAFSHPGWCPLYVRQSILGAVLAKNASGQTHHWQEAWLCFISCR
jgi:hypothetical protein